MGQMLISDMAISPDASGDVASMYKACPAGHGQSDFGDMAMSHHASGDVATMNTSHTHSLDFAAAWRHGDIA